MSPEQPYLTARHRARKSRAVIAILYVVLAMVGLCLCLHAICARAADADYLPDPHKTPGAVMASCTLADAKRANYTAEVRNVPASLAKRVYASYGQVPGQGECTRHASRQGCEVDHLISLVLCGDNVQENLWIQSYHGSCNAHDKDALEDRLHKLVKDGTVELATAQAEISTNWIAAYRKYVGPLDCGG